MSVAGISYNKNQECFVLDCFNDNVLKSQSSIKKLYNEQEKMNEKFVTSRMHSKTGIFVAAIFILGISCAVAFLSYSYLSRIWGKHHCHSPLCRRSAQNLIAAMNASADPCENFYNFACGNFANYKPTANYSLRSDWFDIGTELMMKNISDYLDKEDSENDPYPVRQARFLYQQCMNITEQDENFDTISMVLKQVGLPVLPPLQAASSNFSLLHTMVQSKLVYGKDYFISFAITMDPKNRTRYRLFLSKPSDAPPLPVHYNHILLYNLKKQEIEEREENNDDLQDDQSSESIEGIYESLSSEENADGSNSTAAFSAYAEAFYNYATNVFEYAYNNSMNESSWTDISNTTLYSSIMELMIFDIQVDKLLNTHFLKDSAVPIPAHISVKKLQNITNALWPKNSSIPIIQWEEYFKRMFEDIPDINLNFEDGNLDAEIVMKDFFYISMMLNWIATMTPQQLELYMWWTTVTAIAPYASNEIRQYADQFIFDLREIESKPRNLLCAEVINSIYGMATAYSLVNNKDKRNDINKITEMVENIQSAFQESMKNIGWMDQKTKRETREKLKNMKTCIGFPPWLNDTEELEGYYEEYQEVNLDTNTYLENVLVLSQIASVSERKSYRKEINIEEEMWVFNPMDVNAYNWLEGNRITIPVGILQFPFYEQGLQVLNYGSIGSIIGHELTHGFDNTGKEYDATGEAHPWWTNETMTEFHKRIRCFVDHYETFPDNSSSSEESSEEYDLPVPKQLNSTNSSNDLEHLNRGSRTLDENIADNGGLRNALYAYRNYVLKYGSEPSLPELKDYSSEQLFFLSFANTWCKAIGEDDNYSRSTDEHSPNHVRVWGTLTNSKEFAEAWQCKEGTPMNPQKNKCEMW